jgi:hypothetical protein
LKALIDDSATDATTVLKARFSLAAALRQAGETAGEKAELEIVAREAAAAGLMREADSAQKRLAELGGG